MTLDQIYARCTPDGDCMLWIGATIQGYPQATINGRGGQLVRRYIYRDLLHKALPPGYVVASRCKSPLCCEAEHLFRQTFGDRLRASYADGSRVQTYLKKVHNLVNRGKATLDFAKAREIRSRMEVPNTLLAVEYGCHAKTIYHVKRGHSWRELAPNASVFAMRR